MNTLSCWSKRVLISSEKRGTEVYSDWKAEGMCQYTLICRGANAFPYSELHLSLGRSGSWCSCSGIAGYLSGDISRRNGLLCSHFTASWIWLPWLSYLLTCGTCHDCHITYMMGAEQSCHYLPRLCDEKEMRNLYKSQCKSQLPVWKCF